MRIIILLLSITFLGCKSHQPKITTIPNKKTDFSIAFGSGNNQNKKNPFWEQLTAQKPDVWIWGGDNIYCDTEDMSVLIKNYEILQNDTAYQNFAKTTTILEAWDDHDYGMSDGGAYYSKKKESQEIFLDFFNVPANEVRRTREGTYYSQIVDVDKHKVKIIMLDTRYFRSDLDPDPSEKKRYLPTQDTTKTMLGEMQWQWLTNELNHSKADFNIIYSSIQVLSSLHGFETWGNMPHEQKKLEKIILNSKAKNVILLSGDRHISEISQKKIGVNQIPLTDFTSSGLTHSYEAFSGEENPYRVEKLINVKSYGLLNFDFEHDTVEMQMWGENNKLLQTYRLAF